ncbi:MAG: DNA-binding protein HU-beta [Candidatus Saganbacteria bacterium]|uniref:DNA-binding protein HU-beta n=1 Tax=Candidatus Saganbacteria bacterium TaxID=2575572 RepID=A0A833NS90_UNCSA|nr:MAG: DNA-binding protein HU-beta [Candidatus Saganbacteria bacterium]
MNKQELCNYISSKTKLPKSQCLNVIDNAFDAITGALKKGQHVRMIGFGTWKKMRRKARKGRNPQTGKALNIPARNVAKFSMSEHLYNTLN